MPEEQVNATQDEQINLNATEEKVEGSTNAENEQPAPTPANTNNGGDAGNKAKGTRSEGQQNISRSKSANDVQVKSTNALQKSVSSEFIALKLDAALKRSIADRTGDASLRKEAQLAQSMADKAGARQALVNLPNVAKKQGRAFVDQLKQEQPQSNAVPSEENTAGGHKKKAAAGAKKNTGGVLRQSASTPNVSLVNKKQQQLTPDASLKFDAAVKRSIADRTGDLALKKEAQLAQSLADKSGARQALLNKKRIAKQQGRAFVKQASEEKLDTPKGTNPELTTALLEHPQSIACRGCGQEYHLSPQATGATLSTHLRDFPEHRKAIGEVPEKDRVYVDKSNYKGSFDHNFADPLNFAPIIPGVSAAGAAM